MDDALVPGSVELRSHLNVLQRRKWLILAVAVALVVAALAWSSVQKPLYSATVQLLVHPPEDRSLLAAVGATTSQENPARLVDTEVEVAGSEPVRAAVEDSLGPVPKASVTGIGDADIIQIRVRSQSPARAVR